MRTRRGRWFQVCGGLLGLGLIAIAGWKIARTTNINPTRTVGAEIDRFEGVPVFYNGGVDHSSGRSTAPDGYNYGLKHQCVEFVKRYYHQRLGHRMPDSYGHAKDFYDPTVADGGYNRRRGLTQHANGGSAKMGMPWRSSSRTPVRSAHQGSACQSLPRMPAGATPVPGC